MVALALISAGCGKADPSPQVQPPDCNDPLVVQASCDSFTADVCTCAFTDPCGWSDDGSCDAACEGFPSHFDESDDCLDCADAAAVQASCSAFTVNKCTCSTPDPCGRKNDGYCDSACRSYVSHFNDDDDCLDCNNATAVQASCSSFTVNKCTCSTPDPCGRKNDGYCDSACSAYANHFDDSSDCGP